MRRTAFVVACFVLLCAWFVGLVGACLYLPRGGWDIVAGVMGLVVFVGPLVVGYCIMLASAFGDIHRRLTESQADG